MATTAAAWAYILICACAFGYLVWINLGNKDFVYVVKGALGVIAFLGGIALLILSLVRVSS